MHQVQNSSRRGVPRAFLGAREGDGSGRFGLRDAGRSRGGVAFSTLTGDMGAEGVCFEKNASSPSWRKATG